VYTVCVAPAALLVYPSQADGWRQSLVHLSALLSRSLCVLALAVPRLVQAEDCTITAEIMSINRGGALVNFEVTSIHIQRAKPITSIHIQRARP